jgi:transposase
VAEKDRLYRCLDRIRAHKAELFQHLRHRWQDLFAARFDLLLYDLTSTYVEGEAEEIPKARHGYSRDGRFDCRQVVIALVLTPEGFQLAYEVMEGNTSDRNSLRGFLDKIESVYGKARRVWMMDRGVPSEELLAEMRTPGREMF